MQKPTTKTSERIGATNLALVVLLSGILLVLIILLAVILLGKSNPSNETHDGVRSVLGPGETARRSDLHKPPKSPKPVGNPDRIKETLQAGKTYRAVVKGGFEARVEDKDWGIKKVINLAYAVEMAIDRTIESNDGKRIVELRHFETCRNVKLLCQVESVQIDLGTPGELLLGALEYVQPGAGTVLVELKPVTESFLRGGAQSVANDATAKAFARVNSVSGKTVRIVYTDGVGVEDITPVDCSLDIDEQDWVRTTAVLSDCYILPDFKIAAGRSWTVDGPQLAGFVDPSLRAVPQGTVTIKREKDEEIDGKDVAILQIESGHLNLDSSDQSTRRVGSFTPRGKLRYNVSDGYVALADLNGDFQIETVSKDHILFEARFRTEPIIRLNYSCTMR